MVEIFKKCNIFEGCCRLTEMRSLPLIMLSLGISPLFRLTKTRPPAAMLFGGTQGVPKIPIGQIDGRRSLSEAALSSVDSPQAV